MRTSVEIVDIQTGKPVAAELFDDVTLAHFLVTQEKWRPLVIEAAQALHRASGGTSTSIPRHWHWDWTQKEADLRMLAVSFFGIEVEGDLQGIIKLLNVGYPCRIPAQAGLDSIYIDYVETAPWNNKVMTEALGQQRKYGAVGVRLVEAAVQRSIEEGFHGRVTLHSLPTSESFYLEVCGMTAVERDAKKQTLLWCEFTPDQARQFLGED